MRDTRLWEQGQILCFKPGEVTHYLFRGNGSDGEPEVCQTDNESCGCDVCACYSVTLPVIISEPGKAHRFGIIGDILHPARLDNRSRSDGYIDRLTTFSRMYFIRRVPTQGIFARDNRIVRDRGMRQDRANKAACCMIFRR